MKCKYCECEIPNDSEFCQYCGEAVCSSGNNSILTYGLDENNPIQAGGIEAEEEYISKLCNENGDKIVWSRTGSRFVDSLGVVVDIYNGVDDNGNPYGPIFVNMYCKTTSTEAVSGYTLSSRIESTYNPATRIIEKSIRLGLEDKKNKNNSFKKKHGIGSGKTRTVEKVKKPKKFNKVILLTSIIASVLLVVCCFLVFNCVSLSKSNEALTNKLEAIEKKLETKSNDYKTLESKYNNLKGDYNNLEDDYNNLEDDYNDLKFEISWY